MALNGIQERSVRRLGLTQTTLLMATSVAFYAPGLSLFCPLRGLVDIDQSLDQPMSGDPPSEAGLGRGAPGDAADRVFHRLLLRSRGRQPECGPVSSLLPTIYSDACVRSE